MDENLHVAGFRCLPDGTYSLDTEGRPWLFETQEWGDTWMPHIAHYTAMNIIHETLLRLDWAGPYALGTYPVMFTAARRLGRPFYEAWRGRRRISFANVSAWLAQQAPLLITPYDLTYSIFSVGDDIREGWGTIAGFTAFSAQRRLTSSGVIDTPLAYATVHTALGVNHLPIRLLLSEVYHDEDG